MSESFRIEFLDTQYGWIDFDITILNQTFHYSFSNVISTQPEELISWLEKIYNKEYCEFCCDIEGFLFYLNYDGKKLRLYDEINILGQEAENEQRKYLHAVIEVSRTELCQTIYKAFREFVSSDRYKPAEWEDEDALEGDGKNLREVKSELLEKVLKIPL